MRVILADDEPRAREVLRYYLEKAGDVEVLGEAATGAEAVGLAHELQPDAAFLDVRMPDLDGVEVAALLRQTSLRPLIVFVTAFENHAVAAFEKDAVDYLVKPLTAVRVFQCVERLRLRLEAAEARAAGDRQPAAVVTTAPPLAPSATLLSARIPVEVGEGRARRMLFLDPLSILVVEAQGKGAHVFTGSADYETAASLTAWESSLPTASFLRVHRSFLVNLNAVSELFVEGRSTFLRVDGRSEAIPVSRERWPDLRRRLTLPD